jgi:CxxC-x17-CxxC domain-containing protein
MKKNVPNDPDVAGLIAKLQEQLASLERKVDVLIDRAPAKPPETKPAPQSFPKPFPQNSNTFAQAVGRHENRFQPQGRPDNRFPVQNGMRQDTRFPNGNRQDNPHRDRMMYKAVCADCKRGCEVPFRPVEGRPIYCQGCFARRKTAVPFKPSFDSKPRELPTLRPAASFAAMPDKPQAIEKKKPAAKKKVVAKKKKK